MPGNSNGSGPDAERAKAMARAKAIQAEAERTMALSREAEELERILEETAQEYDQLADDWLAAGDAVQSERTRDQAMQVRAFAEEVGKLANMSAEDARHQIAKIHEALRAIARSTVPTT